ncbi:protein DETOXIFICATION 9-like [Senna tora]|uniref:Protein DETOXIFICATION n=1 Tax=Senna tora TaxID=362788 RepID=A0A834TF91_9FABA|nr:protein DETOXIFICATION 9-like [Senna tora]
MATQEEVLPLLAKCEEEEHVSSSSISSDDDESSRFWEEMKRVSFMAAPMVAITVCQYVVEVVSMMMVGHINGNKLSFSAVAIATSFAEATGFALLVIISLFSHFFTCIFGFWNLFQQAMAGALETLCGQNYGAEEYSKLGNYTCCAIITLMLVCVPISVVWIFIDRILLLFGQDPLICEAARIYCIYLIPALFGYAVLQSLVRYLQTQSMMFPMVLCSSVVLCLHIPVCWILVFKLGMGYVGAALAIGISYWFNVIGLGLYAYYSSACDKTRIVLSTEAFLCIGEFLHYAVPSGLMLCFEWWSSELLILLSGLLPNPRIETSVLSICHNFSTLLYFIPYAIGAAASTRVSNEVGAGNPKMAQNIVRVGLVLATANALVFSISLFLGRDIIGYAYSNEKEVVQYVAEIVPFLCLSVVAESLVGILSGITMGGGFQRIGVYVNLGAYYVVGAPIALLLGFSLHFGAKGFWLGILSGSILQAIVFTIGMALTDWNKEAIKAKERLVKESIKAHNEFA